MRASSILALLLLAAPAGADEMRYPATGAPAVTLKVPDGWSAKEADGKFVATSADGATTVTVSIVAYAGSMDALAAESLKDAPTAPPALGDRHAITLADLNGYWWELHPTGPEGTPRPELYCNVMLGGGKAMSGLIVAPDSEGAGYHAGLRMLGGMKQAAQ
ncbi:MAG: hypothetical protein JOZ72_04050 [Alphaproteobacteria bacterium]|nr:hypothetical protein [Alphaproteobacteria bacterium]